MVADRGSSMVVAAFAVPGDEGGDFVDAGGEALSDGLVDEYRGGGGDVEGVGEAQHRFSSPMATAEFSKFAGILNAALSQHHLLGFEIA